ncbi:MAG: sigma-54-dependent Fis family transcriptional regulator, partial [Myxococcales bacterium]|nr:sigma-54-dependent Fis family transcriptional regulator [Myxococcales bacterium]
MDRIWYVDDDEESFQLVERNLVKEFPDAELTYFTNCEAALEAALGARPDIVVLDERFAHTPMQGRQLLPELRQRHRRVGIVMVTAHPTVELAVSVMRMGATDFIVKPFAPRELLDCVHRGLAARRIERRAELLEEGPGPTEASFDGLVGSTQIMRDLMRRVEAAATTDATVVITGETGTGKGLLAKYIHRLSKRSRGPFVDSNLAATTEALMESTLFGHERGAFTGAESRRLGKFELAKGGTIFLDEIGDLSPTAQLKLLRVLEDGVFERVGGTESIRVDARVVAATNQDLLGRIAEKKFREDLYFR